MLTKIAITVFGATFLAAPWSAFSQETPRTFRFVSEWRIPPQNVAGYSAELDKTIGPPLETFVQAGTVLAYGLYTTAVMEDEGITNGLWFEVPSLAAMENVRDRLAQLTPSVIANSAIRRHDYLLRVLMRNNRPTRGAKGYFYINSTLLLPGKRELWKQWWVHYQKPMYDKFLAEGLITSYELDSGEIHTMDPNWVFLAYVIPSAEALDRINNEFRARVEKRSQEENEAINSALEVLVVPGSHRDYLARTTSYATK